MQEWCLSQEHWSKNCPLPIAFQNSIEIYFASNEDVCKLESFKYKKIWRQINQWNALRPFFDCKWYYSNENKTLSLTLCFLVTKKKHKSLAVIFESMHQNLKDYLRQKSYSSLFKVSFKQKDIYFLTKNSRWVNKSEKMIFHCGRTSTSLSFIVFLIILSSAVKLEEHKVFL